MDFLSSFFTLICYLWAFSFLIAVIYFLIKSDDKLEAFTATAVFGNCFSLVFWITTAIAHQFNILFFPNLFLKIIGIISVLLFLTFIVTIIYTRITIKKNYPN